MKAKWNRLAEYLAQRSKVICQDNHCTEDQHNCESWAYIAANGDLLDICCPDYFQGSSKPYAAIPLPWSSTGDELAKAVERELA